MKKIFLLIQFAALTAGLPAFAIVGGPFDNGDYSILNERNGYYQASFTFANGNGYALWTPDALIGASVQGTTLTENYGTGSLLSPNINNLTTHNANRSVFYYKGITYFGSATGSVDFEGRTIQGYCNANSEFQATTTTTTTGSGFFFFGQQNQTQATSSNVVSSGRSYVLNLNYTGEITDTAPQLRFDGEGEVAIIAPNGNEAIAGLAYSGFSGLINSINQSISQLVIVGVGANNNSAYLSGQQAISSALAALTPYLTGTGPTSSYAGSEKKTVRVTGYRRYF